MPTSTSVPQPAVPSQEDRVNLVALAATPEEDMRNRAAAVLSLVPGLGHLYKGHVVVGGLILFVVSPLVGLLGLFLAPMTFGLSLVIPLGMMLGVMVHAWQTPDRRQVVPKEFRALERGVPEQPAPDSVTKAPESAH